jgi:acylphosphatase
METKSVQIIVSGHVQGVWYRKTTEESAKSLGVKGFVRNLDNGQVYIEAEGNDESIAKLLAFCKIGPPGARVDQVEVKSIAFQGFKDFKIR